MDTEAIFRVGNRHGPGCGEPPHIGGGNAACYYGYFENEYGEQAVFVYDRRAQTGTLWMGDNSQDNPVSVVKGSAEDVVLGEAEALWLKACWMAASAG